MRISAGSVVSGIGDKQVLAKGFFVFAGSNQDCCDCLPSQITQRYELTHTKTMFEYTRVTAPFTGVITKRYADTGSMIQAGTASQTQAMPLVKLSENSLLRLILPVPESAVPRVHVGQQVDVRVPTLDRNFPGKVARFSEKVQPSTRTMETEVDVPNASLLLIPGMYAEVNLTMDRRARALAIPLAAAGESKVMVVTADNRLEVRKVELGIETANFGPPFEIGAGRSTLFFKGPSRLATTWHHLTAHRAAGTHMTAQAHAAVEWALKINILFTKHHESTCHAKNTRHPCALPSSNPAGTTTSSTRGAMPIWRR